MLRGRKATAGDSQSAFPYGVVDFQKWVQWDLFFWPRMASCREAYGCARAASQASH